MFYKTTVDEWNTLKVCKRPPEPEGCFTKSASKLPSSMSFTFLICQMTVLVTWHCHKGRVLPKCQFKMVEAHTKTLNKGTAE